MNKLQLLAKSYLTDQTNIDWSITLIQREHLYNTLICSIGSGDYWSYRYNRFELIGIHEFLYQLDIIINLYQILDKV